MQLTRWTPRHNLAHRNTLFPALMDDIFTPFTLSRPAAISGFMPTIDIYEKEDKVYFEAEVPGFKKDDLHIDVKGKVITFSGERKMEENDGENRFRKERKYGKFERSFHLGFEVGGDAVEAKYENGILTAIVTKPQEQQAKKIQIN